MRNNLNNKSKVNASRLNENNKDGGNIENLRENSKSLDVIKKHVIRIEKHR